MRARVTIALVLVSVLTGGAALGDPELQPAPPFAHLGDPSVLTTHSGIGYALPPGYWYDEPTHDKRETELKTVQDERTQLKAENTSLRAATSGWQPGWRTLAAAIVVGLAGGWYLHDKL